MVKEHYNKVQTVSDIERLEPNDKAQVWMDKLLAGEIDLETFKSGLDVLLPQHRRGDNDVGYL